MTRMVPFHTRSREITDTEEELTMSLVISDDVLRAANLRSPFIKYGNGSK